MLVIFTMALEVPTMVGVNKILNVLEPLAAKELAGLAFTLNCDALAPVKIIELRYKTSVPVFVAEKVRVLLVSKLVLLAVLVVTPTGMLFPLPLKASVTEGAAVVVNPLLTPPGLTQLDAVPVNAKLIRVPVLAAAASVRVVTAVLEPEGIP